MKKITFFLAVMIAAISAVAQQPAASIRMKAVDTRTFSDAPLQTPSIVAADYNAKLRPSPRVNTKAVNAISATQIGSSGNILTVYQGENNHVAAHEGFSSVVFIHRNNPTIFPLTNSQFRYDISTDKGATWNLNIGPLNPLADGQVGGINGRYPQTVFHNPAGNTVRDSMYGVYFGAWHNGGTGAAIWDGTINGVYRLDGNSTTWTEANVLQNSGDVGIASSLTEGLPGEFWAVDVEDANLSDSVLLVYKGVWSSSTHDVAWTIAHTLNPGFNLYNDSTFFINPVIAFDPTGMKGWIAFSGDIAPNTNTTYEPVFYKTTDGGVTWTGPIRLDLTTFPTVMNGLHPSGTGIPTTAFQTDLAVDANGDPHYANVTGSGSAHSIQSGLTKTYMDFTYNSATSTWMANPVDTMQCFRGTICTDGSTGNYITDNRPQVSTSPSRDKVFFFWSDTDVNVDLGNNTLPDLVGKGYDINTQIWSPTINFSLNDPVWGSFGSKPCAWPSTAPTSFRNAANDACLVPTVVTGINVSGLGIDPCDHYYFNNIQFDDALFVSVPEQPKKENSVLVFPNPTVNEFTLSYTGLANENAAVTLVDMLGKTVRDFGSSFTGFARYSIRGLDAGIYFVNIRTANEVVTKRIEISR
jgi:hypothetical protein